MSHIIRTSISLLVLSVAAVSLGACTTSTADAGDETAQAVEACDLSGSWAIKVATPVKWKATFVLQEGSGMVTNWIKTSRTITGAQITDTATLCGAEVADYQSTALFANEKYGIRFPASLFDEGRIPQFKFEATMSGSGVGATYSSTPVATVVGATLANPATDPWPASAGLSSVDTDNDSFPGVAGDPATGAGYQNPPLNPARTVRAKKLHTAFRQSLTSTGTVKSCDRVEGTGKISVINNKAAIDAHVLGCQREDGSACAASEVALLDSALPVYVPSADATVTMVRIPANATCAQVRALAFEGGAVTPPVTEPTDPPAGGE